MVQVLNLIKFTLKFYSVFIVGAGAEFQQEQADIQERLSRTYGQSINLLIFIIKLNKKGGGDMDAFPELNIAAPDLHQDAIDGERTIDIEVSL